MKKVVLILMAMLMCFTSITTAAQGSDAPRTLTLEKALEKALSGNIDLQQAHNQLTLAGITLKKQKNSLLPVLSFSADASRRYSQADLSGNGDTGSASFNLQAGFNLFNGFADVSAITISRLEQRVSRKTLDRSIQSVLFEIIRSYMQTLASQEYIQVEEENLKSQQIQLQLVEDFYNAGKKAKADLYQQQAEIAAGELNLLNARRSDHDNKLSLRQLLGEAPRADYQVADPGTQRILQRLKELDPEKMALTALGKRPDLQGKKFSAEAAWVGIKSAASGYWPTVSLSAGLGSKYSDQDPRGVSNQLFDDNISGSVAVTLSVPLFDGFNTASSVAGARISHKNSLLELEKAEKQVQLDVQQALQAYLSARAAREVSEKQLTYSGQALEILEARYKVNAATMAELIQTRAQWLDARYNEVEARYNLIVKAVELAYQCGDDQGMIDLVK